MFGIAEFFITCARNLMEGKLNLAESKLEEIVLKSAKGKLAYIDDRKYAKEIGYDLWKGVKVPQDLKDKKYAKSNLFPDFLFRTKEEEGVFKSGYILELKDTESKTGMASFNSTIPTSCKTLEEIDAINGGKLVSKIARLIDSPTNFDKYYKFDRRCFYLVRSGKGKKDVVKLSIIDGSFFETVPKERLFYQMFLQVLYAHLDAKKIKMPLNELKIIENALKHITDQRIIASSKTIEKASIKPRLRIMAEVHPEGNPHGNHYNIPEKSFNLILHKSLVTKKLKNLICEKLPNSEIFTIRHKRNGEYIVFSILFGAKQTKLFDFYS